MKCYKCGKEAKLIMEFPQSDGIPFYCEYCFKELEKEINNAGTTENDAHCDKRTEGTEERHQEAE